MTNNVHHYIFQDELKDLSYKATHTMDRGNAYVIFVEENYVIM